MSLSLQMAPDCKVIILPKSELDKANKDKKHKHFPSHFQVLSNYYCNIYVYGLMCLECTVYKKALIL